MEVSMLQQVSPRQENYMQGRADALRNVESTISELGGIFTQLATMVAQQGELAIRFFFFYSSVCSSSNPKMVIMFMLNHAGKMHHFLDTIFFTCNIFIKIKKVH